MNAKTSDGTPSPGISTRKTSNGFTPRLNGSGIDSENAIQYLNLKLSALGEPPFRGDKSDSQFLDIARPLISAFREKDRFLSGHLCPADRRIQDFLDIYLKGARSDGAAAGAHAPKLPAKSLVLDRAGLARLLSIAPDRDSFVSGIVRSYRVRQGILHNPENDRRTTQGVFHVAEGGLPIPDDKYAVPKHVFRNILDLALRPPKELMTLPFTASQDEQARVFVSLLLRPAVCPEIPGYLPRKSMEIRFFAPGNLVSNLDFVESIFGNAGDPGMPENDAALDVEHWTGHTGCVILAPHLIRATKKELGLPRYKDATERQRRDGMCWKKESDLYNDGQAFKATARDHRGVIVTVIADNYFGYCKKEVKTQISYSANLYGISEEEHSGGAIAFANYDLGEEFLPEDALFVSDTKFHDMVRMYGNLMDIKPECYGVDRKYPEIIYVPENARFSMPDQEVSWSADGKTRKIRLSANHTYILPSGYKIRMKKQTGGSSWHLFGTVSEGTFCHKPCTVSGGGKSEISKSIVYSMIQGPVFTSDFHKDMDQVAEILKMDFSKRFKVKPNIRRPSRSVLSANRSLGSVIKLFTPSPLYTDDYNAWLKSIPHHVREIIFVVKRVYKHEWGDQWRSRFSVDVINGHPGHELKYKNRKLVANYLRVGHDKDGSWRIYKVRQDFSAADKVQTEDDITVSATVSRGALAGMNIPAQNASLKLAENCENRLFQRPDDAILRGYDKQAEEDLAGPGNFLSNFEPLTLSDARELIEDAVDFDRFSDPMKKLLSDYAQDGHPGFIVSSAHPRIVEGKPSKNPRYLQNRPDLVQPRQKYLAEIGARLRRRVPLKRPVLFPVDAVLAGRRNNPPDRKAGVPALAVYNPIHYQELPELFMDFVSSLTGKSPSTTGFGSEGALTKGPFNALSPVIDLNNALISFMLTGYPGFTTAAGHVGPDYRIDHDISLLIPEIWCRMTPQERDPAYLIKHGYLEKMDDIHYEGEKILASRLGYRITQRFANAFLGRIFNNPTAVLNEEMLKPETQDYPLFIEGIRNIAETQRRVARHYFNDGSVNAACPPLKALLHVMAYGHYKGKAADDPSFRALFTRESMMKSAWYRERLAVKRSRDSAFWMQAIKNLEAFSDRHPEASDRLDVAGRLAYARKQVRLVRSSGYLRRLSGTIGADPFGDASRKN